MRFDPDDMGNDSIWHGRVLEDFRDFEFDTPLGSESSGTEDIQELLSLADPGIISELLLWTGSDQTISANPTPSQIADRLGTVMRGVTIYNQIQAGRQTLGEIGMSVGFLGRDFNAISSALSQSADVPMREAVLRATLEALRSNLLDSALDAIGAIPVVGWIIDIVAGVALLVMDAVEASGAAHSAYAERQLQRDYAVPMHVDEKQFDANKCYALFSSIHNYNATNIVRPRYQAKSVGDFNIQGIYDPGSEEASGLRISGGYGNIEGIGFMPGTGTINDFMMLLYPQTGGKMRDVGSLYPTAQSAASQWWSVDAKKGPALYTVDTRIPVDEWSDLIISAFALAKTFATGWAAFPMENPAIGKTTYKCAESNYLYTGCDPKKDKSPLPIPDDYRGHRSNLGAFASFLAGRFFAVERPDDLPAISSSENKFYNYGQPNHPRYIPVPSNIDVEKSTPIRALRNLRERQEFALRSLNSFYVNGEDPEVFEAFRSPSLREQWRNSIVEMLNHGDWKKVVYRDMPEGPAKDHVRERILNIGENPETFNLAGKGMMGGGAWKTKSVLGDPSLPEPPTQTPTRGLGSGRGGVSRGEGSGRGGVKDSDKGGGGGTALLAAAAAGAFIMAKRK